MIDPHIEAALLPLLNTEVPFNERFKAVFHDFPGAQYHEPKKPKRKRDVIIPAIDTNDYRELATYFMAFLFRHFPALESVSWETEMEYDDSTGYTNDPFDVTINGNININYCRSFRYDFGTDADRAQAIDIEGLDPLADINAQWAKMSDADQTAWYEMVERMGGYDKYEENCRQEAVKAYLDTNHLLDLVFTTLGLINVLAEQCHSRSFYDLYGENSEPNVLAQRFPAEVRATKEGITFSMREH